MKEELKKFLDKPNEELLNDFKWGNDGANQFSKFMILVREELNYTPAYKFIRMVNNETGEVKETSANDAGFDVISELLYAESNPKEIVFEGNKFYKIMLEGKQKSLLNK